MFDKLKEVFKQLPNEKIIEAITHIPGVQLGGMFLSFLNDIPARYNSMSEEKKQALFESLVSAGTKAANDYAKK